MVYSIALYFTRKRVTANTKNHVTEPMKRGQFSMEHVHTCICAYWLTNFHMNYLIFTYQIIECAYKLVTKYYYVHTTHVVK